MSGVRNAGVPVILRVLPSALQRSFFARPTLEVARDLVGALLIRQLPDARAVVRVVEVEAYLGPADPASHAFRRTRRSEVMWGPPGTAYVYFSYGNHFCLNVVTEREGTAGAVLLRAGQPLAGLEVMVRLRGTTEVHQLCSGPGRLTQALAIDGSFNRADLTRRGALYLARGTPPHRVATSPRIGIRRAADRPWRFFDPDSPFVSRRRT
ncbi:MAG: DNA-3-methyladenine glycosylase [Armatimonadota bacterium]|nr:DNA-3-methyladenine glycosylase [Armatimonadota bacterium]MDR5698004.1 DNA-3-methyladenine glycosylase [Armatimonadota bacterium]